MKPRVSAVIGRAFAVAWAALAGCSSPNGNSPSDGVAGSTRSSGNPSSSSSGSTGPSSGGNGGSGSSGSTTSGSGGAAGFRDAGEDAQVDASTPPLICTSAPPDAGPFSIDATGITFNGSSGTLRVEVCQADVLRVEYTPAASIPVKTSLAVNATWPTPKFCVSEMGGTVTIT